MVLLTFGHYEKDANDIRTTFVLPVMAIYQMNLSKLVHLSFLPPLISEVNLLG